MESSRFNIVCPTGVIPGRDITKEKRQEIFGSVSGGAGTTRMEDFQRKMVEDGTGGVRCEKTSIRICKNTLEMVSNRDPMTHADGFEYTEDFDGLQVFDSNRVFNNFKSVSGSGGVQTRTIRDECYPFIESQLNLRLVLSYSGVSNEELKSTLASLDIGTTEFNRIVIVLNARSRQATRDTTPVAMPLPLGIDTMTNAELKKECKVRKITVSGNKKELVARLKEYGTPKKNLICHNDYFANIFDGNACSKADLQFDYLKNNPIYADVKKYVYVGDLKGYFDWVRGIVC